MALAFVDIDHLKIVNDAGGDAAGDARLITVADAMRAKLRPYDLIIRLGDAEFACVLGGLNMQEAALRMALVGDAIKKVPRPGSVTVGRRTWCRRFG